MSGLAELRTVLRVTNAFLHGYKATPRPSNCSHRFSLQYPLSLLNQVSSSTESALLRLILMNQKISSISPLRRLPVPLIDSILHRMRSMIPSRSRLFSASCHRRATVSLEVLDASKGNRERIVILGSGWAG